MLRRPWIVAIAMLLIAGAARAERIGTVDFEDVPKNHWAYEAVQVCARLGIFEGFEGYEVRRTPGSPASSARVLTGSVEAAGPGPGFAPQGIRPRLSDPLAESFAREMERMRARREEAARIQLPPRPTKPRKSRRPSR